MTIASGAALALAVSVTAHAQESKTDAKAPGAAGLEEIIVTAARRELKLQDVPSAITAVTGETLERDRIVDLGSLASSVPSFSMTEESAMAKELSIRGISSVRLLDASAESSIGFFVDDVYISRTGSAFTDFYDLERIEVIRGPQGVLLGKNVVGGAISVVTAKPKFSTSGRASFSYGNYGATNANGYITGALTDNLAARVAFQMRDISGYSRNVVLDLKQDDLQSAQIRGELLYRAAEADFEALLTYDYGTSESNDSARPMSDDPFAAGIGGITAYRESLGLGPRESTSPQHDFANRTVRGASLRIDWGAFAGAKLTAITGYRNSEGEVGWNQLGATSPPAIADTFYGNRERPETISQEFRLVSDNAQSKLDWIVGAFYEKDEVLRYDSNVATSFLPIPALSGTFLYTNKAEIESAAVFGQVGYRFTDQLKLTVGLRYTHDDKQGHRLAQCLEDGGDGLCIAALELAAGESFAIDYGKTWSATTPQAILEYRPNEDVMVYGSVAKGYKGGGWDHLPSTAEAASFNYDPEHVTNYEIGVKSDLLERRLRLNVAAFQMDYTDLQSQQLVLDCLCLITSNVGTATIKGIEAETTFAVTAGLTAWVSGSWLDAEYDKFTDSAGTDFSGNQIQRSPKYKYSVGFDYGFGAGAWTQAFNLHTSYTRQGKLYWTPANTYVLEPFGLLDASLRINPPAGPPWSVTLWGKNLTDELYPVYSLAIFGDVMNYYAPPRTYGVEVSYQF